MTLPKAMILAGGYGTRLRKVVFDRPKSMAPIAGIPFLEHQLRFLKRQGIQETVLAVSYMADKIKSHFGDGRSLGIKIAYSEEEMPLGTAGALKHAEQHLDKSFFVINGDSYAKIDLQDFYNKHLERRSSCTLSVTEVKHTLPYGVVELEGDKITAFKEKQGGDSELINSGVYLFEPDILKRIPQNENVSLEKDIFPRLAAERILYAYRYNGYFMDIGRPETYERFKRDIINSLILKENQTIRDALARIDESGINLILVADKNDKLQGFLTEQDIRKQLVSSHQSSLEERVVEVMQRNVRIATKDTSPECRIQILSSGAPFLPIIGEDGKIDDVEFRAEEIAAKNFPIYRGRAPLRISFAGGGTDLPYYFDKHGGAVINATIDKYCHGTIIKRADPRIMITSDLISAQISVDALENLIYNGNLDMVKAVIRRMAPIFGLELYLYNDVPPGRGLGSSAAVAGLVATLLNRTMGTKYNDEKIAEIAYLAEREELGIRGGWQDQYATVIGGFNFMEFSADNHRVLSLRLKEDTIEELTTHLLLCYVGLSHNASEVHQEQERSFHTQGDNLDRLKNMKDLALKTYESLTRGEFQMLGRYLNESWEHKRALASYISNGKIDRLYQTGLTHGAYGGKLLGAGNGGYLLFFYQPKRRNELVNSLTSEGGDILSFRFDQTGIKVWEVRDRF